MLKKIIQYRVTDKNQKTEARGFWYDAKSKKLFYDYIQTQSRTLADVYQEAEHTQEIALFYVDGVTAYVLTCKSGHVDTLTERKTYRADRKGLKQTIKALLREYNGLTVFIKDGYYLIETWSN